MLSKLWSAALAGLDAYPVRVEVDVGPGLAGFSTVGLPDMAVRESRERVIAAIRNTGLEFPLRRITVNLAPADRRKEGSAFDLPIALGILAASGQLPPASPGERLFLGELSLDGALKPLRGALALAQAAAGSGARSVVVPEPSAGEAALCPGVRAFGVRTLAEIVEILRGAHAPRPARPAAAPPPEPPSVDLAEVRGQAHARRALEIAAAGGHNLLFVGPPGAGKTLLARALPGILPPLGPAESLEVSRIHSVAGLLGAGTGLLARRPFRAPHHTLSYAALVGGGHGPRPGEVSLAHRGVLFMDELPEHPPRILELLRQPLEEGRVVISRISGSVEYPARFMLVAAANPCACGLWGVEGRECHCTPGQLARYRARISGPILDRIDLEVAVPAVPLAELTRPASGVECSAHVRGRVAAARTIQARRWAGSRGTTNADVNPDVLLALGTISPDALRLARRCAEKFHLSARGFHRLLRVSRTVADLEDSTNVSPTHAAEAAAFRRVS